MAQQNPNVTAPRARSRRHGFGVRIHMPNGHTQGNNFPALAVVLDDLDHIWSQDGGGLGVFEQAQIASIFLTHHLAGPRGDPDSGTVVRVARRPANWWQGSLLARLLGGRGRGAAGNGNLCNGLVLSILVVFIAWYCVRQLV